MNFDLFGTKRTARNRQLSYRVVRRGGSTEIVYER